METEFRVVPGFEDYGVSQDGRLKRLSPRASCVKASVFLKPHTSQTGYIGFSAQSADGQRRRILAHRAVALAWIGPAPDGKPCVAHLDGCRSNNDVSNLAWVSYAENEAHKIVHGTVQNGQRNPAAKLTETDVLEMRSAYGRGEAKKALARRFGISDTTVRGIVLGRWWRHVGSVQGRRALASGGERP